MNEKTTLKKGDIVTIEGDSTEYVVKREPWKFGGAWVCMMEGKKGSVKVGKLTLVKRGE